MITSQNSIRAELNERVKELHCLYRISEVVDYFDDDLDEILQAVVEIIPDSLKYSDSACVTLVIDSKTYMSNRQFSGAQDEYIAAIRIRNQEIGTLQVHYTGRSGKAYIGPFMQEEILLINAVAERIGKIHARIRAQESLKIQEESTRNVNIALREILHQVESEKDEIRRRIKKNIDYVITPLMQSLENSLKHTPHSGIVGLIRSNLRDITREFVADLSENSDSLTMREIQICDMVRQGLTSKEAADILNITQSTVHNHREHIRKKLGLRNRKVNLAGYLQSLGTGGSRGSDSHA